MTLGARQTARLPVAAAFLIDRRSGSLEVARARMSCVRLCELVGHPVGWRLAGEPDGPVMGSRSLMISSANRCSIEDLDVVQRYGVRRRTYD